MLTIDDLKAKKVLVIDDTVTIHKLLTHQLNDLGFENVSCAINAMAAWTILEDNPVAFSLIFCDFNMPEINGIEFLKKVRADNRFKDLVFIMLTMESDIKLVNESIEEGVNGYILKPYTKATVQKCIEHALRAIESPDKSV